MAYIIDLQRLWQEKNQAPVKNRFAHQGLDPRKKMVSVVLVVQTGEEKLVNSLKSILQQPFVREIIVVNEPGQESIDLFLSRAAEKHPKCVIVRAQSDLGLPDLFNQGAQYASSPYLLFIDSNCILPEDAVYHMLVTGMQKQGPWIIGAQDTKHMPLRLGLMSSKSMEIRHPLPEVSLPGGGFHIAQVQPQCVFMPTNTFMELKGMDKNCFDSAFHYDLCLRVHLEGGGVYTAKGFRFDVDPIVMKPTLRQEWQSFRGWCHFYGKYVNKKSKPLKIGAIYSFLMLRFLARLPKVALGHFS